MRLSNFEEVSAGTAQKRRTKNVRLQLVEKVELYIKSSMGGGTPPLHFAKIPLFLVGATFRRPLITESKCGLLTDIQAHKKCAP